MSNSEELSRILAESTNILAELQKTLEIAKVSQQELQSLQTAVQSSQALAEAARVATESARSAAESDREGAIALKSAIETIRVEAAGEKDKAVSAAADAAEAKKEAEASKAAALVAKIEAEAAKATATVASQAASEDGATIQAAKTGAETEWSEIKTLKASATASAKAAKQAESESDAFKNDAALACDEAKECATSAQAAQEKATREATKAADEAAAASEAHNLSTTAGLAGAFNVKALSTQGRERFWGVVLVGSLTAAGVIGWVRYSDLADLLRSKPELSVLYANVVLALLGVGAPVWLAWMSTQMISKNFALAEDYAYKASLAKAYVGFRTEAKNLDPIFEQRLFAAAITQLDANPVRFLSAAHPGSPLQDLLQQQFMQDYLQDATIREKMVEWIKKTFRAKLSPSVASPAGGVPPAATPVIK